MDLHNLISLCSILLQWGNHARTQSLFISSYEQQRLWSEGLRGRAYWSEVCSAYMLLCVSLWAAYYFFFSICRMTRTIFLLLMCSCVSGQQLFPQSKWAASWQNQQNDICAQRDSDQPGHPPSLIRAFAVRMKKHWVLSYPLSVQRRLISLGGCPGWSESSLGAHIIWLVLSWGGSSNKHEHFRQVFVNCIFLIPSIPRNALIGFNTSRYYGKLSVNIQMVLLL